ncbi:uncharacterized protein V6R79_008722 [Siganus canaliculatus]
MNPHSTIWGFIYIFLSISIKCGPLLTVHCQDFMSCAEWTVNPGQYFVLGSNLTVYCHIQKCKQRSKISLEFNKEQVKQWEDINSTSVKFSLFNVQTPLSFVRCKLQGDYPEYVGGLDLHGGFPPDKPEHVTCETSRTSHLINCSWERGQKTHITTYYNVSVKRENGSQMLLGVMKDAERISIPREMADENTTYQFIITAYNRLGASQSEPVSVSVKNIVIPETPQIVQIQFNNKSLAVLLHWKTNESSERLTSDIRLRALGGFWVEVEGKELSEGLIEVDGLKPLTEYEFQMRTCTTSGHTETTIFMSKSKSRRRSLCSKWSCSVTRKSPGKGPSQQLDVWRVLGRKGADGLQLVMVLWKPLPPDDYSGEVQRYQIFLGDDHKQKVTCHATLSQCPVHVPAPVQTLSISAVTTYGESPPAHVLLTHSGDLGLVLKRLAPAANGSAVLMSWSWLGHNHWTSTRGELQHYVLEWTHAAAARLQWQKLAKGQNSTVITGLAVGVRYNISLYAVTSRGVSAPLSDLVYSKEQKPVSSPNISVLVHEALRIWIQWDELPLNQQRGFITNYTIYLQKLESSHDELIVKVSSSDPRQKWLDCPEGPLALQLTASTSAGEGPRGDRVLTQPANPGVGLAGVIVFIVTLFVAIIANLMCWSCVRKRIKETCVSWGPAWFHENLPRPGNSIAIRLLQGDSSGPEPPFTSTCNDPPLSPISFMSEQQGDDTYPNIHVELPEAGCKEVPADSSLPMSHPGTLFVDSLVGYKPQIAMFAPLDEELLETEEEQSAEEERCSGGFRGLLGGFLATVEVDFSDCHPGSMLGSVTHPFWPKTPETTRFSARGYSPRALTDAETDSFSVDLQQGDKLLVSRRILAEDPGSSPAEAMLVDGYFPQMSVVHSATLCDMQR